MKNNKRFEVIETQGMVEQYQVIRDNNTGVLYMSYSKGGRGAGLTVMMDQEGKSLVDEDYLKTI